MKELLKIEDLVKPLAFKTHQVNLFWNIGSITTHGRNIDFDVFLPSKGINLQRPFCWTLEQKQQLILSIIKGIYIPKIAVLVDQNNSENPIYQIIDGKQRLGTMIAYLSNDFPLHIGGIDFYFKDCNERLQHRIKGYSPICEAAYFWREAPISDKDKIEWFEQINFAGTPQDIEHLKKLKI